LATADLNTITAKQVRRKLEHDNHVNLEDRKQEIDSLIMACLSNLHTVTTMSHHLTLPAAHQPSPPPTTAHYPPAMMGQPPPLPPQQPTSFMMQPPNLGSSHPSHPPIRPLPPNYAPPPPPPPSHPMQPMFPHPMQPMPPSQHHTLPPSIPHSTRSNGEDKKKKTKPRKKSTPQSLDPNRTKRSTPLTKPMALSSALMAVVGVPEMGRAQVVKAIWAYIRQYNLQDPNDKRYFTTDEKLRAVFNGLERLNCFEMNKYLSAHLTRIDHTTEPKMETKQTHTSSLSLPSMMVSDYHSSSTSSYHSH
jgi:upstream activation factor subunit UAF30